MSTLTIPIQNKHDADVQLYIRRVESYSARLARIAKDIKRTRWCLKEQSKVADTRFVDKRLAPRLETLLQEQELDQNMLEVAQSLLATALERQQKSR